MKSAVDAAITDSNAMLAAAVFAVLVAAVAGNWDPYVGHSNPYARWYSYGSSRPDYREPRDYTEVYSSRRSPDWDNSPRVHPWTTPLTGLLPWADSFHGAGLPTNWQLARAYADIVLGDPDAAYSPYDLYTNSQINPLAVNPLLPGGESPLLAGANPHGIHGIGSLNLGSPVGLSLMGSGTGTGVGWLKDTEAGSPPFVGYGPQGSGYLGNGIPLTDHPIFYNLPGIYHPPASNVFF